MAATNSGWDFPLLTFIYAGFDSRSSAQEVPQPAFVHTSRLALFVHPLWLSLLRGGGCPKSSCILNMCFPFTFPKSTVRLPVGEKTTTFSCPLNFPYTHGNRAFLHVQPKKNKNIMNHEHHPAKQQLIFCIRAKRRCSAIILKPAARIESPKPPRGRHTVDGRNPFRTTLKPWETIVGAKWISSTVRPFRHHGRASCPPNLIRGSSS